MRAMMARFAPWLVGTAALVVLVTLASHLWGKLRREVWLYFTDDSGKKVEAWEEKARPVLWEDPRPSYFDEPGQPQDESSRSPAANRPGGPVEAAFSADETMMTLVLWDEDHSNADLYLSQWDGRSWSRPVPVPAVNTPFNERGPAFSTDGRYLFFASNRSGGAGGYDLYVARWNGSGWSGVERLDDSVNSPANELGPSLSPDGASLFFSSDRTAPESAREDIFVAARLDEESPAAETTPPAAGKDPPKPQKKQKKRPAPKSKTEPKPEPAATPLPPVPSFGPAQPISPLNSDADDVQAAVTARGRHVFLASDRNRSHNLGYEVYLSRFVNGEMLPPEKVDLHLKEGDATDPAVRMDGFDLLFTLGPKEAIHAGPDTDYRLYRSTTREVIGYTDLGRWAQFKTLMRNIAWWLLLAVAALIALIYLLERWEDITSLFHKCLAASAGLHLLLLLLMMIWLVAKEIDSDVSPPPEITVNIDALAQEELALESIPEETALTDPETALATEKAPTEFDIPDFEPKESPEAQPLEARTAREAVDLEFSPARAETTDLPIPPPPVDPLLAELSEPLLPDPETPRLEERTLQAESAPPEPSQETFEPKPDTPSPTKAESREVADRAVETPAESAAVDPAQPLPAQARQSAAPAVPAETAPVPDPVSPPELESELLRELPQPAFVDAEAAPLEESGPARPDTAEPVETDRDVFEPAEAVARHETSPAESRAPADAALARPAETAALPAEDLAAATGEPTLQPSTLQPPSDETPPASPPVETSLPETALTEPAVPRLEETDPSQPREAPSDPSEDLFQPEKALARHETTPADPRAVSDAALAEPVATASVAARNVAMKTARTGIRPPTLQPPSDQSLPPSPQVKTDLPETALADPAAPRLDETGPSRPAGPPADPTRESFKPAATVARHQTAPANPRSVADNALAQPSPSTEVAAERLAAPTANSTVKPPNLRPLTAQPLETPTVDSDLPETALADPATPRLEETGPSQPPGTPADPSHDVFKPAAALANLSTKQAGSRPLPDAAVSTPTRAANLDETAVRSPRNPRLVIHRPRTGSAAAAAPAAPLNPARLDNPSAPSLLPKALDTPRKRIDPATVAKHVRKHRGKPSLETVKQLGGSGETERAIRAAVNWLVTHQEDDGRWDTRKHGAKSNYDTGGTALAMLCFYGWGARHDQPGKYQPNVRKALRWLLAQQKKDGDLSGPGRMYCHAIASIALCEAYGITRDPNLKPPAERSIAYTLAAQHPSKGGWRYNPGDSPDTSITAWQIMALHSARMAGLAVPESAFEKARLWLDLAGGGRHGGLYGYQKPGKSSPAMIAAGMFCRQLDLVPPTAPIMRESAQALKMEPIDTENPDFYHIYYATLALYQHQGPIWQNWNTQLRTNLPLLQRKTGRHTGSWDLSSGITSAGGRVASTTLATLSLEVYYHLLPIYGFRYDDPPPPDVKTSPTP